MYALQTVWAGMKKSPGKTLITLLTVGLGVGVLICSLNISSTFSTFMDEQLAQDGLIVTVANAEYSDEGGLEGVRPPEFDSDIVDVLRTEISGVQAVSPIPAVVWTDFKSDGGTYRIRNGLGVNEQYADIMSLEFIAGAGFMAEDIEKGTSKVVVTEDLAEILFGSSDNAVGQLVKPPITNTRVPGMGRNSDQLVVPTYEVTGVFANPSELKRKSYGIGDMLIPYTAILPGGVPKEMAERMYNSTVTFSVSGSSFETVEAQVRDVLARQYDEDTAVHVWEGTPDGTETVLIEARESLRTVTVVINLLGFILLITGAIGILSIMIVEVAGRNREISMKQALGAHKGILVREFWMRAMLLSGLSGLVGVVLSLIFLKPLQGIILPIFEDIRLTELAVTVFQPSSIAIGLGAALVFGGIFGIIPVFSALKTPISEGIREV